MENNESTPRTPLLRSSKEQPVSAQKIIVPRQQSSSKSTCSKSTQVSRAPSNSDHPTSSVTTTTQAFDWLHEGGHFPQQYAYSSSRWLTNLLISHEPSLHVSLVSITRLGNSYPQSNKTSCISVPGRQSTARTIQVITETHLLPICYEFPQDSLIPQPRYYPLRVIRR